MARRTAELARRQTNALTADEAEELFSKLDETGHVNDELARIQHARRRGGSAAVEVDPLADEDPSGSNVGKTITRTAVSFVALFLVFVVGTQVAWGVIRRANTANLSEHASLPTVAAALRGGVEWGDGFTQFPSDFSVQEADENTGRIEVTVIDTTSTNSLECLSSSQIQATAFAVNALLNPNINTVVYHVNAHVDDSGRFQTAQAFGFLKPSGNVTSIMTFVWTKTQTTAGVSFSCTITGVDSALQGDLRDQLTTSLTPVQILGIGDGAATATTATDATATAR